MSEKSLKLCQLKVTLKDIEPAIWRRIVVPLDCQLEELHDIIQTAMGWESEHLFEFEIRKTRYEQFGSDDPLDTGKDATSTSLEDLKLRAGSSFTYIYDFGDNWTHHIKVEKIRDAKAFEPPLGCRGGENKCPPEDCGGFLGYKEFLAVISDKKHPRREELSDWFDLDELDPTRFDVDSVNEILLLDYLLEESEAEAMLADMDDDLDEETEESTRSGLARTLSTAVTLQLMANNPPETRETLERLTKEGLEPDDALAMVVSVLGAEMFNCVQLGEPFDNSRLLAEFEKLPCQSGAKIF